MVPDLIWILAAAETATDTPADIAKMIGGFAQYGVLGVVVVLFLTGLIVSRSTYLAVAADRDNWRDAHAKESEAHQATRVSLAKAEERADIAVEQGRTLNALLSELGHRPDTTRSV
ncbi:hypothetical protein OH738_10845 [Streptomyces hirsutus]|uniref:hypothetical protein n=1 Tax=Streptomyces hirsutus TaxID=35620 RepID=UPI003865CE30|nr:hypothetical protein OH738_10845 [Streptomyces hirsutus]